MPLNMLGAGQWNKRAIPLTLAAGAIYYPPAGQYLVNLGPYTMVEWFDPVSGIWRPMQTPLQSDMQVVSFDGYNQRIANLTGTCVGAYLTNGGTGYPNGIYPAGTPQTGSYVVATLSGGGATVQATVNVIVGGAIGNGTLGTAPVVVSGGAGYNNPPTIIFPDPPVGGVKASAIATISGGAITGITMINQGAGYTIAPATPSTAPGGLASAASGVIQIIPHPLDTPNPGQTNVATPASITTSLTGSGRITAMTNASIGNGYTSAPSYTFAQSAGSTGAATPVMCLSITGITAPGGGSANQTAAMLWLQSAPLAAAKTNAPVNPQIEQGLFIPRIGQASSTLSSGVASAIVVQDGGLHQVAAASVLQLTSNAWATAAPTSSIAGTLASGGNTDTVLLIPI